MKILILHLFRSSVYLSKKKCFYKLNKTWTKCAIFPVSYFKFSYICVDRIKAGHADFSGCGPHLDGILVEGEIERKNQRRRKRRRESRVGEVGGANLTLAQWFNSVAWFSGHDEGRAGGGGEEGVDLIMSCFGPSPSKGGPWKALLITTCDETSRTKTAGAENNSVGTLGELEIQQESSHPASSSPYLHTHTNQNTHSEAETHVDTHLCLLWQGI